MTENRRRFTRVPFNVVASLMVSGVSHPIEAINDLSVGGCNLKSDLQLAPETDCELSITLGDIDPRIVIQIAGRIVRSRPGQVGVKFTGIDPEGLYHLQRIILYNSGKPDTIEKEIEAHPGIY